eukprot:3399363-Rhodomonas_salina.2
MSHRIDSRGATRTRRFAPAVSKHATHVQSDHSSTLKDLEGSFVPGYPGTRRLSNRPLHTGVRLGRINIESQH